jgi:hypothetical protein
MEDRLGGESTMGGIIRNSVHNQLKHAETKSISRRRRLNAGEVKEAKDLMDCRAIVFNKDLREASASKHWELGSWDGRAEGSDAGLSQRYERHATYVAALKEDIRGTVLGETDGRRLLSAIACELILVVVQ